MSSLFAAALPQPLTRMWRYGSVSICTVTRLWSLSYLQGVFSREALVTVGAWKRLDCQVDPLVSFQVVVPIEALGTLVALEWPVVRSCLLVRVVSLHEVRHLGRVPTVEARHHSRVHANKSKPTVRVLNV